MEATEHLVDTPADTAVETDLQEQPTQPRKRSRALVSQDVRISKIISYVLRHGAIKEGLRMRPDGYMKVEDLLRMPRLRSVDLMHIEKIVKEDPKGRYNLIFEPSPPGWLEGADAAAGPFWWIRANQGHSLEEIEVDITPVTDLSHCPTVVHGTNKNAWQSIQKHGLSRMKRNHIHFAQGLPGTQGVVSGMRNQADIFIYIDIAKALADDYKFFISQNGVVLCPGDSKGFLPPKYFLRVETVWKNYPLPGYEGTQEKSGEDKLKGFDEKNGVNAQKLGHRGRPRYEWADPIQGLLKSGPNRGES